MLNGAKNREEMKKNFQTINRNLNEQFKQAYDTLKEDITKSAEESKKQKELPPSKLDKKLDELGQRLNKTFDKFEPKSDMKLNKKLDELGQKLEKKLDESEQKLDKMFDKLGRKIQIIFEKLKNIFIKDKEIRPFLILFLLIAGILIIIGIITVLVHN